MTDTPPPSRPLSVQTAITPSPGPISAPAGHSPISKTYSEPLPTQNSAAFPPRPTLGPRKSSGSIIIPRDSPTVELATEEYGEGDARAMSPRRSSDEIELMGVEARREMEEQARVLQKSLSEIVERVESVKSEHERLEGGCRFLESYIGELMQTSKITSSGAAAGVSSSSKGSKGRGRK